MGSRDPRVDAYVERAAEFARPILRHLREVVHGACPDVVETIKWGHPQFEYKGPFCGMAAFKAHAAFGFWKHALVVPDDGGKAKGGMWAFGRLTAVADLPSKAVLARYVKKAMGLNDEGIKVVRRKAGPKKPMRTPRELEAALAKHAKARATYEAFSPSHRREYAEWIGEAKRPETRQRRVDTAIEWLAEGKARNWKHERC